MDHQNPPNLKRRSQEPRFGNQMHRQSSNSFPLRRDSTHRSSSSISIDENNLYETPKRPKLDNDSLNNLSTGSAESVPPSPWEWQKTKGEVVALKSKISHLEDTIQQLHRARHEVEEVCRKEKKLFEIQIEQDKSMIKQLELRVDIGRKNVKEAQAAQMQAEKNLFEIKSKMEQKVLSLLEENAKLTEELRKSIKKECTPDSNVLKSDEKLSTLESQLEAFQKRVAELEQKLRETKKYEEKYETQSVELRSLKIKVETLESEKVMLEDNKKFMTRAAKVTDLEKELEQANKIIASLRESVKGKLLLEEQMATIEHRLQRTENLEKQISQLEITQGELLSKIADYESIGITGGPAAIKREISRLQHAEMILTAEEGQLRSQVNAIQEKLEYCQKQHQETKKQLAELTTSHERLSRFLSRVQKKMTLVTRERDSYRQQLDTYEKEITGYQNAENPNLLNERIPALERAIEGYRELVAKFEADLEVVDGKAQSDEINKLKEENYKLKDELAHRALKGDFNIKTKILHFTMNPAATAIVQAEEKQKALLQEVEQLRAIVSSGKHANAAPVSSLQAQEIAELQQKHELKISRLKEAFKASSHEYRQACYQLFGWRVDRTKEGQYKLSSQYAESPDDYLFFIVNEDGVNMIETPFSSTLTNFIEQHLKLQHSVPMFLNAVQCDLFDQQTITNILPS